MMTRRGGRPSGAALGALALMVGVALAPSAEAASVPWYGYKGDRLVMSFWSPVAGKTAITWRAVGPDGRPRGARGSKRIELKRGNNGVALDVGRAGGHRVELRLGRRVLRIWANRGVFAAGPAGIEVERERGMKVPYRFIAGSDIQLARAFRATVRGVTKKGTQLAIERSFGYPKGQGVRPGRGAALVMVARAARVAPVRLSLAQRRAGKLEYFDYYLVLEPKMRRYQIPLRDFRARGPRARPIAALHSVAIAAERRAKAGDAVTIGFFGLGRSGPRITRLAGGAGYVQAVVGGSRGPERTLYHAPRKGGAAARVPISRAGRARVAARGPLKLWACQRFRKAAPGDDGEGGKPIEICDPPDAPHTHYAATPAGGGTLVDDFAAGASVNALRQPLSRFASSYALRQKMRVERRRGRLRWRFTLDGPQAYVGLDSDLGGPAWGGGRGARNVVLGLRGDLPSRWLTVQLTNRRGKVARINVGHYLDRLDVERWQRVMIPLAAFQSAYRSAGQRGRFGSPTRLSLVSARGTRARAATVEVNEIRFTGARGPVLVATFDSGDRRLNALSGGIGKEATGGARLELGWDEPGKQGRALKVTVSDLRPDRYAILTLGLGGLDVRKHSALTFWIRGERGGERPKVLLASSRRRRAGVELADHGGVGRGWRQVRIPLTVFDPKKVRHGRLQTLIFSWERRSSARETIWLDGVRFE